METMVLAVRAENLWIGYLDEYSRVAWIIHGIKFSVYESKVYCIVGESGCGKSTLGRAIVGILPPHAETRGKLWVYDELVIDNDKHYYHRSRGRIVSFIPQNPGSALHPLLSIKDQFKYVLKSRYEEISDREIREKSFEALRLVGLNPDEVYSSYPHELSGGMQQRAAIALALVTGAKILVADEPTSSLDAHLRLQILELLKKLRNELGLTLIMITHDLLQARKICDRIAVIYAGHLVEEAPVKEIYETPLHPYTKLLLETTPILGVKKPLKTIPGEPISPETEIPGCPFHPRCPYKTDKCIHEKPIIIERDHHKVACWLHHS